MNSSLWYNLQRKTVITISVRISWQCLPYWDFLTVFPHQPKVCSPPPHPPTPHHHLEKDSPSVDSPHQIFITTPSHLTPTSPPPLSPPPTTSLCRSITWFPEFMWEIKYFIYPVELDQWPLKMTRMWLTVKDFYPYIHITF